MYGLNVQPHYDVLKVKYEVSVLLTAHIHTPTLTDHQTLATGDCAVIKGHGVIFILQNYCLFFSCLNVLTLSP